MSSLDQVPKAKPWDLVKNHNEDMNTEYEVVLVRLVVAFQYGFATSRTTLWQQIKPKHVLGWLGYKLVN